jgi:hypothetical protein
MSYCINPQNQNIPNLTEVDPIGKTWEKHRVNADKVAEFYAQAGDDTFNDYAWRLKSCSEWLEFRLVPEESADTLKF